MDIISFKKMIAQILPLIFILYCILKLHNSAFVFIVISLIIQLLYFLQSFGSISKTCILHKKTLLSISIPTLYFVFMVLYQPSSFIYYLPYVLSISRKIYLFLEKNDKI